MHAHAHVHVNTHTKHTQNTHKSNVFKNIKTCKCTENASSVLYFTEDEEKVQKSWSPAPALSGPGTLSSVAPSDIHYLWNTVADFVSHNIYASITWAGQG